MNWALNILVTKLLQVDPLNDTVIVTKIATHLLTLYAGMSRLLGQLCRLHHLLSSGELICLFFPIQPLCVPCTQLYNIG